MIWDHPDSDEKSERDRAIRYISFRQSRQRDAASTACSYAVPATRLVAKASRTKR